jgi:uncharacterized protein involved in exopolysaccharide biosynthesis
VAGLTGASTRASISEKSLGDHLLFVRRNLVLLSVFVLLGLGGGGYAQMQADETFTATASILLAPVPTYVSLSAVDPAPSEITIDTDAQLVRYRKTLESVALATGEDKATVAEHLNVTAPTSTRVLDVSFIAPNPDDASVGAATAAAALLDARQGLLTSLQADQIRRLKQEIGELQAEVDTLGGNVTGAVHRQELLQQLRVLTTRRDALDAARSKPGELIGAPTSPLAADPTYPTLRIGSGAMIGLLIGIVIGLVRDSLRNQQSPSMLSTSTPNR